MAKRDEINIGITADAREADRTLERTSEKAEQLDRQDVDIAVTAQTSQAEGELKKAKRAADDAEGGVRKLGDTSDQSRSVLANMVGNASQDLGELAGIAGTAGVAVGQIGEYAADGNIALSGLVKTALPMLAIGLAVGFITDKLAKAKREAQETEDALLDAVGAFRRGDLEQSAEKMGELFGDLARSAEAAGLNASDVFVAIADGSGEVAGLEDRMVELFERGGNAAHMSADEIAAHRERLAEVREGVAEARVEWLRTSGEMGRADTATGAAVTALERVRDAADGTAASFDRLKGALDMEASFLGAVADADALEASLGELARLNGDVTASDEDRSDAARQVEEDTNRLRATVLELVEEYGEIPEEELTRIRAELPAAQQAAFDAWLATIEQGATVPVSVDLTAALAEAERRLERWRTQWAQGGGGSGSAGNAPRSIGPMPSATYVTIHAPQGMSADAVVAASARYARRNGGSLVGRR